MTSALPRRRGFRWRGMLAGLLLALVLPAPALQAGDEAPAARIPLEHLAALRGDYFRLHARSLDRAFHIYVRLPEGYAQETATRYPVVYLLDGDSLFPILASNHLFLHYDEQLPEAVVVGIAYGSFDPAVNRRGLDFSAAAADAKEGQGGAAEFHAFLERELLPEVERRYRVDPERRVLFGQSRGGYFVLYSAYTAPDLFWGRIASNPVFDPGRERFHAAPAAGTRRGLGLVVTSGSRDRPALRQDALGWFEATRERQDLPWALHPLTIEDGTHAADSARSYRAGMLWLFGDRADATP